MSQFKLPTKIYIAKSKFGGEGGLGVFAMEDIKSGEIIEEVPVILLPEEQISDIAKTNLLNYFFGWGEKLEQAAIALGYGSIYNHSYEPNTKFVENYDKNTIIYSVLKDVKKDAELLTNYNGDPEDKHRLWFMPNDGK